MVATSPCYTLPFVLFSLTDLSVCGLVYPWVWDVSAPGIFTSLCMHHWPTSLSGWLLCPSPAAAEWSQSLGYGWVAYGFGRDFPSLSLLRFLYCPWLISVAVESFLMGCTSVAVFSFLVFRPVRSSVVSTHTTARYGVRHPHPAFARGMRDCL